MEITEKVELNKEIKSYDGDNSFMISLQNQLRTNSRLKKEDFNGKLVKVLSDKQYKAVKRILS